MNYRNPYLKGRPAPAHIRGKFRAMGDPWAHLDDAARRKAIQEFGQTAQGEFQKSVSQLAQDVRTFNPFQLLGHFAYIDQLHLQHAEGRHGYEPVSQPSVEWLQALVLQVAETDLRLTLERAPTGEELHRVNQALHTVQEGYGLMRLGSDSDSSPTDLAAEIIRQHTAFIRNEGYPAQIQRLHEEIFRPLDQEFLVREGITLSGLSQFLWALVEFMQKRIDADRKLLSGILRQPTAKRVIAAFSEVVRQPAAQVTQDMAGFAHDDDSVRTAVINWMCARSFRLFMFSVDDLPGLFPAGTDPQVGRRIVERLCLPWGELAAADPERLLLDNPVWTRPFIAVGATLYYCPLIGLVQSFGLEIVEGFLQSHADLWTRYGQKVRPAYLEARTETAVRAAYPDGQVFRQLKWQGDNGREYETDLLMLLDTHALIVECKSGRVRARAQRGDAAALKDEIEKLIGDPSRQGKRFADYLLAHKQIVQLTDGNGQVHTLDLRRLLRATSVNVTLDYVGPLSVQQRLLQEANLVSSDAPLPATMPLHELENVLEILDQPPMSLHYFRRRAELAQANHLIGGELDMLALYLATGFDFGDVEGDAQHQFALLDLGGKLNPYFMGRDLGCPVPKPKRQMRGWWNAVLAQFAKKKFPGWVETSQALLSVNYEKQDHFERLCRQLVRSVRHNSHKPCDDTCIMLVGPPTRRTGLIYLVIKNQTRAQLHALVDDRISRLVSETPNVQRVLCLATSALERTHPYLGSYFHCPEMQETSGTGLGQALRPPTKEAN